MPRNQAAGRLLLQWYDRHGRNLPWRRTRDPYAVWVSEVMLQQTQVATVLRYYGPFLEAFPSVRAVAESSEERVMKAWEGLGYYGRARRLKRACEALVARGEARVPEDPATFAALPGVGPYTAAAVASIAFGVRAPSLDANVLRVGARVLGEEDDPRRAGPRRRIAAWVDGLMEGLAPGEVNQALMDLGASVCTPATPACFDCPLRPDCAAHRRGLTSEIPPAAARARPPEVRVLALALVDGGRILLRRRPDGGLLGGLWEVPSWEADEGEEAASFLRGRARAEWGAGLSGLRPVGTVRHAFTHRRWRVEAYLADAVGPTTPDRPDLRWAPAHDPGPLPVARVTGKVLALLGAIRAQIP